MVGGRVPCAVVNEGNTYQRVRRNEGDTDILVVAMYF